MPGLTKRKRGGDSEEHSDADTRPLPAEGAESPPANAFAKAFAAVMKRSIAPEKGAVLAKRRTLVQKQLDREKLEHAAANELRKQRKAARVAQLVVPAPDVQGYERQLRKVATKGVVALFNAINKHQRAVAAATTSEAAVAKKARQPAAEPGPRVSLLDLFQPQHAAAAAATAGPAAAAGTAPSWSVLADDFVKHDTSGDAAGAADLLDDDDDDDERASGD